MCMRSGMITVLHVWWDNLHLTCDLNATDNYRNFKYDCFPYLKKKYAPIWTMALFFPRRDRCMCEQQVEQRRETCKYTWQCMQPFPNFTILQLFLLTTERIAVRYSGSLVNTKSDLRIADNMFERHLWNENITRASRLSG